MKFIFNYFILFLSVGFPQFSQQETESNDVKSEIQLFRVLYQKKRLEHKEAIQSIAAYTDYGKQYKIIEVICEKSFPVLHNSQIKLRESGYIPGMDFPSDEVVKEALALLLEITAFMSEIVLHFPDIAHKILKDHQNSQLSLTWGILFASQSTFLDENTRKLIYLVSQELGLAEADPNYTNPYVKSASQEPPQEAKPIPKKKRKTFKKGPRMSGNDEL